MSHIIIDWDHTTNNSELQIIDIYPTNLIEIPLDEYELADYAYYDALGAYMTENKDNLGPSISRYG
jgi:hypothetical protein